MHQQQRLPVLVALATLMASPAHAQTTTPRSAALQVTPSRLIDSVVVTDAWARPALKGGTGGAYMTITNNSHGVVRIVSATSSVATATELHASTVHSGMAHMEMLTTLVITPGASVSLKPGGTHFMLVGLRNALIKGDSTRLMLRLHNGAQISVNVAVRTR